MADLIVFQLEFTDTGCLEHAFGLLVDEERVTSCSVEPDTMTARFMAAEPVGGPLVEKIYGIGGLRWCSRHAVQGYAR